MAINFGRQTTGPRNRTLAERELVGKVVDNKDPEKKERIKVRIKGLHDDIKDENLPWMLPNRNGAPANGGDMGSVGPIPPIGSAMRITFRDDTMYHAVYSATPTGEKQQAAELQQGKDETGNDYPNVYSTIDSSGNRLTVNNKRDTVDYEHVSGTRISIDGKGHVAILVGDKKVGQDAREKNTPGFSISIEGPANIRCTGNINLGSDADINIVAKGKLTLGSEGITTIVSNARMFLEAPRIDENAGGISLPKLPEVQKTKSRKRPNPNVES